MNTDLKRKTKLKVRGVLILPGYVNSKKSPLTCNLCSYGVKVASEPPEITGQVGCLLEWDDSLFPIMLGPSSQGQ